MAADLLDYAHLEFPNHEVSPWRGEGPDLLLQTHTLVVHVVGVRPAAAVLALAEHEVGDDHVGAVIVRPHEPTVWPTHPEDTDGVFDLPMRRIGVSMLAGAGAGLVLGLLVGALAGAGHIGALVIGGFAAVVGGTVGGVAGGGARHAAERATTQPQAAGHDLAIVAAFLDDEQAATSLARAVADTEQQYDMRIVGIDGRWHVPDA
jgi:hypothetical protein